MLAKNEAECLSKLDHNNIIKLYNFWEQVYEDKLGFQTSVYFLELEYACNGSIHQQICEKGDFSEDIARFYFRQLIWALDYLHSAGYSHRDIKLENLLLDEEYNLKLIDFGFACEEASNDWKTGTLCYMAPEIFKSEAYDWKKTDVFSSGIVLYALLTGKLPFEKASSKDTLYNKFLESDVQWFWLNFDEKFNSKKIRKSDSFKDLFTKMVDPNPANRITIKEIKEHDWFMSPIPSHSEVVDFFNSRNKTQLRPCKPFTKASTKEKQEQKRFDVSFPISNAWKANKFNKIKVSFHQNLNCFEALFWLINKGLLFQSL